MELTAYEEYLVENPYGGEPIKMFEVILHSKSMSMKLSNTGKSTNVIRNEGEKIPYFGCVTIITVLGKEVHHFTSDYSDTPAKTILNVNPEDCVELMNIDGLLTLIVTRYTGGDNEVEHYLIRQGYRGVIVRYPDTDLSCELWQCHVVHGHYPEEITPANWDDVGGLSLNEPFRLMTYSKKPYELHGVFYQLDKEV